MEDFVIDMVMPDGGSVRVPISPFYLDMSDNTIRKAYSAPQK
jgi:hypothetical protein